MVTMQSSAFKPYFRDGVETVDPTKLSQLVMPPAIATPPQDSPPKVPDVPSVDLFAQMSLLAGLKNYADPTLLAQFGLADLATAAHAAAQLMGTPAAPSVTQPTVTSSSPSVVGQPLHQAPAQMNPALHPQNTQHPIVSQPSMSNGVGPMRAPHGVASTSAEPYGRRGSDQTDDSPPKGKRKRTTYTPQQALQLEKEYEQDQYMPRSRRIAVAETLHLAENQIKTWFQNRRAKDKKAKSVCDRADTASPPAATPAPALAPAPVPAAAPTPTLAPNLYYANQQVMTSTVSPPTTQTVTTTQHAHTITPQLNTNIPHNPYVDLGVYSSEATKNIHDNQQFPYIPLDIYQHFHYDPSQIASMAAIYGQQFPQNNDLLQPQQQQQQLQLQPLTSVPQQENGAVGSDVHSEGSISPESSSQSS